MNICKIRAAMLLLAFVGSLVLNSVLAAEPEHGGHSEDGNIHAKKHFIGSFLGTLNGEGTDTTIGIEYEYKFDSKWGIGLVYEDAAGAHHGDGVSATIGALYFHPAGGWRLGLGLGQEKVGGAHSHTESLRRVGVSYDFHLGGFGIEPSFNVDRVDGETSNVIGVAFVWSF